MAEDSPKPVTETARLLSKGSGHNPLMGGAGLVLCSQASPHSWVVKLPPCATRVWHTVAEAGPKLKTEIRALLPQGSGSDPLSSRGGTICADCPLYSSVVSYHPVPLEYGTLWQRMVLSWRQKLEAQADF